MVIGKPMYLRRNGRKGSQKIIARWRCGNEEEKNKYWRKEEDRRCRIYNMKEGAITHIWTHVGRRIGVDDILGM